MIDDLDSTGGSQRGEYSDSHANGTQVAQPANHVGGKYSGSLLNTITTKKFQYCESEICMKETSPLIRYLSLHPRCVSVLK